MYAMFTLGVAPWLGYDILLISWPIIIANSITLLLAGTVLLMKLKFGKASKKFVTRYFSIYKNKKFRRIVTMQAFGFPLSDDKDISLEWNPENRAQTAGQRQG